MKRKPRSDNKGLIQKSGSPFFRLIWNLCRKIPKGKTATYGYLARASGNSRASRAVGMAMARNPYAPKVPCHRVICADQTLGGYSAAGGLNQKRALLEKEGVRFDKSGRVLSRYILKKGA